MSKCLIKPVHLETCPYCRSLAVEVVRPDLIRSYAVRCNWCGAQGPTESLKGVAVDRWNNRSRKAEA